MANVICVVIAYLLGSIETALILSKLFKFPDPRKHGSHSAGATNVLRTAGKNQAVMTLVGDVLKGVLAVIIAIILHAQPFFVACAALAAVVGHIFPCFFQFRGGKGVATAIGGLLILSPVTAVILVILWLILVFTTRYVSLASIVTAAASPIFILIINKIDYFFPILIMAILIIWKHKDNIRRLRKRVEPKVKLKT